MPEKPCFAEPKYGCEPQELAPVIVFRHLTIRSLMTKKEKDTLDWHKANSNAIEIDNMLCFMELISKYRRFSPMSRYIRAAKIRLAR